MELIEVFKIFHVFDDINDYVTTDLTNIPRNNGLKIISKVSLGAVRLLLSVLPMYSFVLLLLLLLLAFPHIFSLKTGCVCNISV